MAQHPLPDFQPSPALASLAISAYAALEIINAASDLEGLDRALDAVKAYTARLLAISPGQVRLMEHFHDSQGNPPPDIGGLCGLLSHQVQVVHHQVARALALSA